MSAAPIRAALGGDRPVFVEAQAYSELLAENARLKAQLVASDASWQVATSATKTVAEQMGQLAALAAHSERLRPHRTELGRMAQRLKWVAGGFRDLSAARGTLA